MIDNILSSTKPSFLSKRLTYILSKTSSLLNLLFSYICAIAIHFKNFPYLSSLILLIISSNNLK